MSELIQLSDAAPDVHLVLGEPECKQFKIRVKWDGCCDVRVYCNGKTYETKDDPIGADDVDYIHVCDLDKFIDYLVEAREKAQKHFGEDWPL